MSAVGFIACSDDCKDCEVAGAGECDTCLDGFYKNNAGHCIGKNKT